MRFIWLALSIVFPLALFTLIDLYSQRAQFSETQVSVLYTVVCLVTIVFIALCVSEFVKLHRRQEYSFRKQIERDRDEDIKKWRKEFEEEFVQKLSNFNEMREEALKHAENLAGRPESRAAADDSAQASAQPNPSS
ncbi:MAG: hypothetical protein OXU62_09710 [Gammaproteobacteria bacterium]|nr:hypothetical protein [Gammaproteobacteria bacterium]